MPEKKEEKGLVQYESADHQKITLSADIVKKYLVQGNPGVVTHQECMFYMALCKARRLNPFVKDCYLIKYTPKENAAIVTSIDYFRKRAKAQQDCQGWNAGCIVVRDGEVINTNGLVLEDDELVGGWFEAQPKGWTTPLRLEVNLNGYLKRKADGTVTRFWSQDNQPLMIAKVAEAQGLRKCWPDEFQGLYGQEEIAQEATNGKDLPLDVIEANTQPVAQDPGDLPISHPDAEPPEDLHDCHTIV